MCTDMYTHVCVCTVMSLLSLEGPYISLFMLLREFSPSVLHPSLLFFVFSPLDPANPPTHPLSVYTAAKGGLPMLEGFSFGQAFNRVWCTFPVSNNGDFPTPPPPKKTNKQFWSLNLFFHLCHSSIWHLFLLVRPLSYPLLMH